MPPPIPTADGDVTPYNLTGSPITTPRVYFVNGIRVLPKEHAVTAAYLSVLIERPVNGVYNATAGKILGLVFDVKQSAQDYNQNATARVNSPNNLGKPPTVTDAQIPGFLADVRKHYRVWNEATLALFKQLIENRRQQQYIVAHSQGNLITSNALFIMEDVLGSAALSRVRVYSLASPSPALPVGLRKTNGGGGRQDNAFMNDLVSLLRPHNLAQKLGINGVQNAGDFRTMPGAGPVSLAPHDTTAIIATLNFLKSIRGDLGLSKEFPPDFLTDCAQKAAAAFPEVAKPEWWRFGMR